MMELIPKMSDKQLQLQFQFQIFESTKKLNLSKVYEFIPKEVSINDPRIEWVVEGIIAKPVKKVFTMDGKTLTARIAPANFESKRSKQFKSHFPDLREKKVELAVISIVSKSASKLEVHTDKENNRLFFLRTTYYQIQKEIVDAINQWEGKSLKVRDCPYSTTDVREALEVLKVSNIYLEDPENKESDYIFTRIKDIIRDKKSVVIELGNMITHSIESGNWDVIDKVSTLASRGTYELKIRILLQLRATFVSKEKPYYRISLNKLINDIDYIENKEKRITLQKVLKILDKMPEIDHVDVDRKIQNRKIIDANLNVCLTKNFISTIIQNNRLKKRVKNAEIDKENDTLIIEPFESDYDNKIEYHKAKNTYEIKKAKALL